MHALSIVVCPFVLFHLAIVLFVLLRYTDCDYLFGIFKLFLTDLSKSNYECLIRISTYLSFAITWFVDGVICLVICEVLCFVMCCVFSVDLRPVNCVINVAHVSALSILGCSFCVFFCPIYMSCQFVTSVVL